MCTWTQNVAESKDVRPVSKQDVLIWACYSAKPMYVGLSLCFWLF
jgi:hypothetical protein